MSSVPHSGVVVGISVLGADLGQMAGDGVNLYQYCQGNPIGGRDPTGLEGEAVGRAGGPAGAAIVGTILIVAIYQYQQSMMSAVYGTSAFVSRSYALADTLYDAAEASKSEIERLLAATVGGIGTAASVRSDAIRDFNTHIAIAREHLERFGNGGGDHGNPNDPKDKGDWLKHAAKHLRIAAEALAKKIGKGTRGELEKSYKEMIEMYERYSYPNKFVP